jgi:hypothetical protein
VNGERGVVEIDRGAETRKWAGWVHKQLDSGKDVYGYISKYYSGYPPTDVETLKKKRNVLAPHW